MLGDVQPLRLSIAIASSCVTSASAATSSHATAVSPLVTFPSEGTTIPATTPTSVTLAASASLISSTLRKREDSWQLRASPQEGEMLKRAQNSAAMRINMWALLRECCNSSAAVATKPSHCSPRVSLSLCRHKFGEGVQ